MAAIPERVTREGIMTGAPTPVMFVHGLWLHATSWADWVELFRDDGYAPIAPPWPGERATVAETRAEPADMARYGIAAIADHFARVIDTLDAKPIVIGHSFGGLIAQNLLGRNLAAAAVAIDAAPVKGVLPLPISALRVASAVLKNPANRKRTVALTAEQFRYGFTNMLSEQESGQLFQKWTVPSPGRPLFEAAFANFSPKSPAKVDTANTARGPLLLIAGEEDHTVPPVITRATLKLYRTSSAVTELVELKGRGHSLTIDSGWREVAETTRSWLKEHIPNR
jgi:pimeloyl-ACP methyl ester carboxylesterase